MRTRLGRAIFFVALTAAASVRALTAHANSADAGCRLARVLELPINADSPQPMIPVKINGQDKRFLVDSGAIDSMIRSSAVAELKLQTYYPSNAGVRVKGVGSSSVIEIARVKELKVAGITIKDGELSVIGNGGAGDGVLGQNVLRHFAVEYDFANGYMRMFTSDGCESAKFAYWLTPGQQYSSVRIGLVDAQNPYTVADAYVNGHRIRVAFDSGLSRSILTKDAASRAGVKLNSDEVIEAGYTAGIGREPVKTYVGRFSSFKIGDNERINNIVIPIADIKLKFADMLVGADFFMSHRIIVGNKEERLLMSYNGGPVFNLSKQDAAQSAQPPVQDLQ
jgi:predicted aspartyl protease